MARKYSKEKHTVLEQAAQAFKLQKDNIEAVKKSILSGDIEGLDTEPRYREFINRYPRNKVAARVMEPVEVIEAKAKAAADAREAAVLTALAAGLRAQRSTEARSVSASDILDFEALQAGMLAGEAVGQINVDDEYDYGSGFLVGENIILTNHHVLKSHALAKDSIVTFNHETSAIPAGSPAAQNAGAAVKVTRNYKCDPDQFYYADADLDFAFVALKDQSQDRYGYPLSNFRPLPLIAQTGKILVGHPVSLIHHPDREEKRVTMHMSFLTQLLDAGDQPHICYYTGDTLPGSSGSPVFNKNWEVIALHNASVKDLDENGNVRLKDGSTIENSQSARHENSIIWISNQGIRTSFIVKALTSKVFSDPRHSEIRDKLLAFWTQAQLN